MRHHSLLPSGCATIVRGTHQDIPVTSDPSGAQVTADNQAWGLTPTIVQLERKRPHVITIELDGYHSVTATITSRQQGDALAGNCLIGGIPGMAVDSATGASYGLTPESIHVSLMPLYGATPEHVPRQHIQRTTIKKQSPVPVLVFMAFLAVTVFLILPDE